MIKKFHRQYQQNPRTKVIWIQDDWINIIIKSSYNHVIFIWNYIDLVSIFDKINFYSLNSLLEGKVILSTCHILAITMKMWCNFFFFVLGVYVKCKTSNFRSDDNFFQLWRRCQLCNFRVSSIVLAVHIKNVGTLSLFVSLSSTPIEHVFQLSILFTVFSLWVILFPILPIQSNILFYHRVIVRNASLERICIKI